jgi:hypothetical protein
VVHRDADEVPAIDAANKPIRRENIVPKERHELRLGNERKATQTPRLKLGKSAAFVKSQMKRLPQEEETWEADFRALPKSRGETNTHYLGVVVVLPKGNPLAYMPVEYTPNVNDLADLLADAIRRPLTGSAHRPSHMHFRGNPRWKELFPHLKELGIETSIHDQLPLLEIVYEDFLRQMRKSSPGPIIMVSPGMISIEEQFPAIAQWVQEGHIEIGDQEGSGFVVRALDYGGQIFEDDKPRTLTEAMAALEVSLRKWFKEQGIKLLEPETLD